MAKKREDKAGVEIVNLGEKSRGSQDFWNAVGSSCSWLMYAHGIKRAMDFLLGMLQQRKPVCRINIGCSSLSGEKFFVPLCDTSQHGLEFTRVPTKRKPFSIISEHTLDEPTIIDDLSEVKVQAQKVDPGVAELPFFRHASLLRLPLFKKNDLSYWINFWSDTCHAFAEKDVEVFKKLLEPCIEGMKSTLASDLQPFLLPGVSLQECMDLSTLSGMNTIYQHIRQVGPTNATVLITGESGVGKEVVAEAVHALSKRKDAQLVRVNCGAFTPSLLTSELFGAEKGAYTGANYTREGYFEYASGGTIFLDEVGELTPEAQVSLLRVLDKKIIQRVGSPRCLSVDVRVIAATNRNLVEMVKKGEFRQDLYFRLATYHLHVPPLRHRREDILPLARTILHHKVKELDLPIEPVLIHAEEAKLLAYDWPGNVRELINVLERSLINHPRTSKVLQVEMDTPMGTSIQSDEDDWDTLEEMEKKHISQTLAKTNGRLSGPTGAAALLGIHYTTLHAKLKKYGLQRD